MIGIGGLIVTFGFAGPLTPLLFIALVAYMIIVYGRLTARLVPGRTTNGRDIVSQHWLGYVVAAAVVGVPPLALRLLAANWHAPPLVYIVLAAGLRMVLAALMVYVLPIVFLRKENVTAIPAGILYLFRNWTTSVWIVGIAVAAQVAQLAGMRILMTWLANWSLALMPLFSVLATYLMFVAFAAALANLPQPAEEQTQPENAGAP